MMVLSSVSSAQVVNGQSVLKKKVKANYNIDKMYYLTLHYIMKTNRNNIWNFRRKVGKI